MRVFGAAIFALAAGCRFDLPDSTNDDDPGGVSSQLRKQLTIDRAKVAGALTGFPVWIALDDPDLQANATEDGADIHFTSAGGEPHPHQIQRWDKSTGQLEAWVLVNLDAAADTVLELRYADPSRTSAPDAPSVFSNGFAAVWHFDDALADSPPMPTVADAKGQRNGTALGGLGPAQQVRAQLGGGIDFDGVVARIEFENPYQLTADHTISAWVYQRTATDYDNIVTVGIPSSNRSRYLQAHRAGSISAGFYSNDWPSGLPDIQTAGWVLLHWTYVSATKQSRIYRDGQEVGSHVFFGNPATMGTDGWIGYAPDLWGPGGGAPCGLNGILDEVRLATVVRSLEWISTELANQSSPQTFYSLGSEEPVR